MRRKYIENISSYHNYEPQIPYYIEVMLNFTHRFRDNFGQIDRKDASNSPISESFHNLIAVSSRYLIADFNICFPTSHSTYTTSFDT